MKIYKKNTIFLLLFLSFFIYLFGCFKVFAREGQTILKSNPVPLDIVAVYQPCEDPEDPDCVPYPSNISNHPDPSRKDHEMGLYAEGLPPSKDIYIIGCILTDNGPRCTTGQEDLDNLLNSYPGGDILAKDSSHEFKALQNPIKTNTNGILENVIIRSYTPQATLHFFYAIYLEQTRTGAGDANLFLSITPAGLQQGIASNFNIPTFALPSPRERREQGSSLENRREKLQDPKGRFFDAQSLEPIPEGEITLLDSSKKIFIYPNLINPQKVKINGEFNFWVPNGIYYLQPKTLPPGYSWPVKITDVNPNYSKAYYCDVDVKDDYNQPVPLYLDLYKIIEYNKLVHCDAPLFSTEKIYRSQPKTVYFAFRLDREKLETIYYGIVTHPLTIVSLQAKESKKTVVSTTADKLGYWKINLSNENYPLKNDGTVDQLVVVYKKVDLTGKTVFDAIEDKVFEPILNYVEGYAYNSLKRILPFAKVGYRQQGNEDVIYITEADDKGYFKIPTRYLPTFSYDLAFLPSGKTDGPVFLSTSEFVSYNDSFLKRKNTNLLTKKSQEIIFSKKSNGNSQNNIIEEKDKKLAGINENKNLTQSASFLPMFILIILLIIIIIVVIFFFNKSRKQNNPPLSY